MRYTWQLAAMICITGMPGISAAATDAATAEPPAFTQQSARDIFATSRKIVSGHNIETQLAIPVRHAAMDLGARQ
jgi:hypothetical protein